MKSNGKRRNNYLVAILLIFVLSLVGCKVKQKASGGITDEKTEEATISKEKIVAPQVTPLNYEWLSYRMNITLWNDVSGEEMITLSVFFVNRKDSIIYIAISKLGIEGARIVITPNSVKYINHLERIYYDGDCSFVNRLLGFRVNFYLLQAIFLGEDLPGFEPNTVLTISQDTNIYRSSLRRNKEMDLSISQEIRTDTNHKVIQNDITELQSGAFIGVQYGNFIPVDGLQLFFRQTNLTIPSEKMRLTINLKNIKVNVSGPTSIKIPEKYTPIGIR
jgi:hypothetical protein